MNYELARELRDAGFPQRRPLVPRPYTPDVVFGEANEANFEIDTGVYIPTLSELIEACGDRFESLQNWGEQGFVAYSESDFVTLSCDCCSEDRQEQHIAKTPEEAVAKLWLALNPVDGKK